MSRTRRPLTAALAALAGAGLLVALPAAAHADAPQGARIAVLEGDALYVKEGGLDADWELQETGVTKFQLDGDRIGVRKTDGSLLVKEGDIGPGWATVNTDSVIDFQLRDGRIAYTEGQDLYVKEGLDGAIEHQDAQVVKFQLEGDRIGVLTPDHRLLVKEGDLGPGWVEISANNVTDFTLRNDRIAYTEGTHLFAQEGELDAPSIDQQQEVTKFELEADRVGVLTTTGKLEVKGGDLEPGWATVTEHATDFKLDGDRIGYLENGALWAQEGDLDAPSTVQETGVSGFDLDGDRVAVIKNGALLVKEGDLGPGWFTADADSATDLQLLDGLRHGGGPGVTMDDLHQIFGPLGDEQATESDLANLNAAMAAGDVDNPARVSAFLATMFSESGLRYNAQEIGQEHITYRGRGYIQLTANFNYQAVTDYFDYNFMADPDAAASHEYSAPIAVWYWTVARTYMNAAADDLDMGLVDRGIGYGANPAEDARRCDRFKTALRHFNDGELPDGINCVRY
ncbi:hypothetical protein [Actinokineospora sp. NBRC 105648]|uniref:hypothetical protein n=1 Tax=Actinokineospora sp. NBRC 105648 TaxID=3032206 RepID=UPI0024A12AA4|nr:hypothetical protein [Actinokineospora sp. NBRC 105648]GLZ40441.1 hypothetical protein Acsp05_40650 [Actinokineospora sp. NBRC 105648]